MTTKLPTRCPTCFRELASDRSCAQCTDLAQPRSGGLALATGTVLAGHYRIGRVLGQPGGFGITYLAWDEKLETRVAIKEFFPRELAGRGTDRATIQPHTETDGSTFEFGLARFLEEARTLARFDHPNIVRVRNFFEANGTGYLVMDYYEGESLSAYLDRQPGGRLEENLAVRIMLPMLDGLRTVHAQGILHRDIDPHNIYLTTQGRVILLDFGAARMAVGDRSRSLSVILKPGYAPYEQYASTGKQGPWTDVYACAATLYRILTGRVPVDAPSRMMGEELSPADQLSPEVSPNVSLVLGRAMALQPKDRLQSVDELQRSLVSVAGGVPVEQEESGIVRKPAGDHARGDGTRGTHSHPTPRPEPPKPTPFGGGIAGVVGVGVLALLLIGFFVLGRADDPPGSIEEESGTATSEEDAAMPALAEALDRALEVRREILDGADFGEVAQRESADPGSAQRGGDLGTLQRGWTVPAFEEAVWSQAIGEVGEPVLTQFGYHIIKVESRTEDQASVRHILIPVEMGRDSEG